MSLSCCGFDLTELQAPIITLRKTTLDEVEQFYVLHVDASVELSGKTAPVDRFQVHVEVDVCHEDLEKDTNSLRHTRRT